MKKITFSILLCCCGSVPGIMAQSADYRLTVTNQIPVSDSVYQFDVFLLNTTQPPADLELAGIQFGLGFDNIILNGGRPTASIVPGTSELNAAQVPLTVGFGSASYVSGTGGIRYRYFNLVTGMLPGATHGTLISPVDSGCGHPGTRIGTFHLTNSVPFREGVSPKHVFSNTAAFGVVNTIVSAYVPAMNTRARFVVINAPAGRPDYTVNTCDRNPVLNPEDTLRLDLHVLIEGYEAGGGRMVPLLYNLWSDYGIGEPTDDPAATDTIAVDLWDPLRLTETAPSYTRNVILHTDGSAHADFPGAAPGNYFIAIRHRNSLETWSRIPHAFTGNSPMSFDLVADSLAAYSDGTHAPLKLLPDGRLAIYSGDVNQDDRIDAVDSDLIHSEAMLTLFGYNPGDCNGDGASDVLDMVIPGSYPPGPKVMMKPR